MKVIFDLCIILICRFRSVMQDVYSDCALDEESLESPMDLDDGFEAATAICGVRWVDREDDQNGLHLSSRDVCFRREGCWNVAVLE